MTLPQQLEPFITQENPALEVAMKAGNLPFPDLEGLYELLHVTSLYMVHTLFTGSHYDHEVDLSLQITHPAQERLATPPGSTSPLFSNSGVGSFTFHKNRIRKSAMRRNLRFADVITKAALSSQLSKDPECWSGGGLNSRPSAQQTSALPTD